MPTRNEVENVAALVAAIAEAVDDIRAELIFVDDSDDGTAEEVARVARDVRPLRIGLIHRPAGERDGGLGGAVLAGIAAARARWVCVMDGDLQHPPTVVRELLAYAEERDLDLVLASRFRGHAHVDGLSRARSTASHLLIGASRVLFPRRLSGVTDPLTGFFIVRRESVDLAALRPDGFKVLLDMLIRTPGLRVGEIGFDFGVRHAGASKASFGEALRYARLLARLRVQTVSRRLVAFGLVGATGIAVNTAALAAFHSLGLGAGLLSLVLATLASTTWLFLLTDRLVFRGRRSTSPALTRFASFLAMNLLVLLVLRGPLYLLLHRWIGLHFLLANVLAIGILTVARFVVADRLIWSESHVGMFRYSIHDLITIESPVRLPELARFRVDRLDLEPRIRVELARVPSLPIGMGFVERTGAEQLSYRERTGFSVVYDFGDTTLIRVSPFLARSPHVLYTNCVEPLIRWTFAEMGFALVHAACVAQGDRAFLITARTDTGKTTTILKAIDNDPTLGFISDDLTLVHPDGRVMTYPKPLTISQHTLHAVRQPRLTSRQRLGLKLQARLHSKGGRSIGMALFEKGLPAATMNAIVQWLVPPPKYDVEKLIPAVDVVSQARLSGMVVIQRGGEGSQELPPDEALETLLENCDDAYGFPPYPIIQERLHHRGGADLKQAERHAVAQALSGRPSLLLRSSTMDWWQRLPLVMNAATAREALLGDQLAIGAEAVDA